ncbi:hypothetical protein HZS_5998 [Henneguya salminicola]|nr:hypothetical protein HZS_5998 [Henneguya salminicola]
MLDMDLPHIIRCCFKSYHNLVNYFQYFTMNHLSHVLVPIACRELRTWGHNARWYTPSSRPLLMGEKPKKYMGLI